MAKKTVKYSEFWREQIMAELDDLAPNAFARKHRSVAKDALEDGYRPSDYSSSQLDRYLREQILNASGEQIYGYAKKRWGADGVAEQDGEMESEGIPFNGLHGTSRTDVWFKKGERAAVKLAGTGPGAPEEDACLAGDKNWFQKGLAEDAAEHLKVPAEHRAEFIEGYALGIRKWSGKLGKRKWCKLLREDEG